jgi:hypothetical protein
VRFSETRSNLVEQAEYPMALYQKILSCRIRFPRYFDKHAKGLVKRLLTVDLNRRYGGENHKQNGNGVSAIKDCKWFRGLDWNLLEKKDVEHALRAGVFDQIPFIPEIKSATDTSAFDQYDESGELPPIVREDDDPFWQFADPVY